MDVLTVQLRIVVLYDAGVLPSFCYLFVSHAMCSIKFELTLHSKNKNLYCDFSQEWFL